MTRKGDKNWRLKLKLYLYIIIYRNMNTVNYLGDLIEKWRQFHFFNFSYKEQLEISFVCHVQMSKYMYKKPRYLLIKKLYFGFFQTFKPYVYKIYIYICVCVCVCFLFKTVCLWGSPRKIFILSLTGFVISQVINFIPENFLKFEISPVSQVLRQVVYMLL